MILIGTRPSFDGVRMRSISSGTPDEKRSLLTPVLSVRILRLNVLISFDEIYPSNEAALTVEAGPSIACSSPVAFRWSKEFENMDDPSGRAVAVHSKAVNKV